MLTHGPTPEMCKEWKSIWNKYHTKLKPNRKNGHELLDYLLEKYVLKEIYDEKALDAVRLNVTMNKPFAEKLPDGTAPSPRAFFVEGGTPYQNENKNPTEVWGEDITKIFIGLEWCYPKRVDMKEDVVIL